MTGSWSWRWAARADVTPAAFAGRSARALAPYPGGGEARAGVAIGSVDAEAVVTVE